MTNKCKYENLKLNINKEINVLLDEAYQIYYNTLSKNEIIFKN